MQTRLSQSTTHMIRTFTAVVLCLLFLPVSGTAHSETSPDQAANLGEVWFDRMALALRQLNFEATLVQSQGQRIQPLVWFHGRYDHETDLELLIHLNGADSRALRIGDQTYYYSPVGGSYSLQTNVTAGFIPPAFYEPFAQISQHYQVIASGGMRVTGRPAQYLRLVSRDEYRYHYDLWIDRESAMLLKLQMMTPQGEVLEQLQLTSILFTEQIPAQLTEVGAIQRPPRLYEAAQLEAPRFNLRPNWLPEGFELRRAQHRRLYDTQLPTDHYLFSDGLTEVSIYIGEQQQQGLPELAFQGAESLINTAIDGYAVTVVGKLPVATLHQIAAGMVMNSEGATQ